MRVRLPPRASHSYLVFSLGLALAAACASAHPDFEQEFYASDRATQNAWFQLLRTRYGCDTRAMRDARGTFAGSMMVGAPVCTVAAFVTPQRISAWKDSEGVREEWEFKNGVGPFSTAFSATGSCVLKLAGDQPVALKVTEVRC